MGKNHVGEQNIYVLCILVSVLCILLCKIREKTLTGEDTRYLKIFSET